VYFIQYRREIGYKNTSDLTCNLSFIWCLVLLISTVSFILLCYT